MANDITKIPAPRTPVIDENTGDMTPAWYRYFYNLFGFTGSGTGVIPVNRGGTGQTSYTDGQLLIGNSIDNGLSKNTLTPGTGIGVVNSHGAIEINNTGVTSVSGGSTGLTPATPTTGAVVLGGVLEVDNGGTGQSSYTDGQLLIGNSTGNTLNKSTLTAGTGIVITNGSGAITIATSGGGTGDVVGPASATDNAIARFDTTTGKLIQNSVVTISDAGDMASVGSIAFDGTVPTAPVPGTIWFDSTTNTWNAQQNAITQQIGEELFVYGRASEAITDGQVIAVSGAYGTTGVVTFEPAPIGTTNASSIIGIATEPIAKNDFGRITAFGTVHDLNTVAFATGDVLYYDPTVVGGLTSVIPSAPNIKVQVGIVTKAAGGTNGSIAVKVLPGSVLGGTDSNVQFGTLANKDLIRYDSAAQYWTNVSEATVFADITTVALTTGTISSVPANGVDLVNKSYVDLIAGSGIHIHTPVLVETPSALTATYVDGGTTPTWTTITTKKTLTTGSAHGLNVNDVIVFGSTTNGLTAGTAYFVYSTPTTTSITLSATYAGAQIATLTNGTGLSITSRANSGVGATLTNAGALAAINIDNVALSVGDRVLVYRQASAFQNGVYTVTTVGSGAVAWVLTRSTDTNTYSPNSPTSLGEGDYFFVQSGDTGKGESYVLTTSGVLIFGTTNLTFTQFSDSAVYAAGTGLNLTGYTFNISNVGTAGTYGSSTLIPVITTNAQGQVTSVTTAANPQGTVTNVSALTLGTTGTDLSSTVATGTTTPVITLNVPTASSANRGALSSTDWSTFNGKQAAYTNLTTFGSLANSTGWLYNNGSGTFSYSTPTKTDVGLSAVTNDAQTKAAVVPNTAPTNGQLLIGNGTSYTPATLTQGTDITITNASGAITIASSYALAKSISAFTTGTAATYTVPAGTEWIKITVVGPGGNGGASATGRATGGGGGGAVIKWIAATPGQTLTYTVGTASGTASTVASGTLTLPSTLSAGSGTNGASTAYAASLTAGPAGGAATGGDVNIAGGKGGNSYGSSTTIITNFSGPGGNSGLGFGQGGPALAFVATAGQAGTGYGAGGGGAIGSATAASGTGGIIIIEAY